jgi:hypothetical protein
VNDVNLFFNCITLSIVKKITFGSLREFINNLKLMCFSANASFGAGIVLTVIGVAAIKKVQHPSQILFASVPLLFAVQQIAEGFIWVTLPNPAYTLVSQVFTYVFLFFAQFFWPLWVPIAILMLEREDKRKKIQKVFIGMGMLVSFYFAYCLLLYHVQANIVGYHVTYTVDNPNPIGKYGGILYFIATVAPPFFSHIKKMWMFGMAILISYIITAIFYDHYVVSVWCFFASIISISIYAIMLEIRNMNKTAFSVTSLYP